MENRKKIWEQLEKMDKIYNSPLGLKKTELNDKIEHSPLNGTTMGISFKEVISQTESLEVLNNIEEYLNTKIAEEKNQLDSHFFDYFVNSRARYDFNVRKYNIGTYGFIHEEDYDDFLKEQLLMREAEKEHEVYVPIYKLLISWDVIIDVFKQLFLYMVNGRHILMWSIYGTILLSGLVNFSLTMITIGLGLFFVHALWFYLFKYIKRKKLVGREPPL